MRNVFRRILSEARREGSCRVARETLRYYWPSTRHNSWDRQAVRELAAANYLEIRVDPRTEDCTFLLQLCEA